MNLAVWAGRQRVAQGDKDAHAVVGQRRGRGGQVARSCDDWVVNGWRSWQWVASAVHEPVDGNAGECGELRHQAVARLVERCFAVLPLAQRRMGTPKL